MLRGYVYKIVNNWEDSDELTIDTFMHIFEKWTDFNTVEHLRRSLFICAKNYSLNHLEAQGRQKRGHHLQELKPWMELDEVEIVEIEFYDIMCHSLHCVTTDQRKVFYLLMDGLTRDEIALELNISPNTVKNHRAHAIKSIQTHLKNKK